MTYNLRNRRYTSIIDTYCQPYKNADEGKLIDILNTGSWIKKIVEEYAITGEQFK